MVKHTDSAYNLLYDAAHDIGEALLAAYGYRTTNGAGQHETVGKFLVAVFDAPPARASAIDFDRMRRDRDQSRYNARPVGQAAVTSARAAVTTLIAAATTQLR